MIDPEQVLGAFHGRIQPPSVSLVRRLGTWLVLGVLVGLVLVYPAILLGLAWVVYWLATSDFGPQIPAVVVLAGHGGRGACCSCACCGRCSCRNSGRHRC